MSRIFPSIGDAERIIARDQRKRLTKNSRRLLRREFFYLAGTIAQQHLPQVLGSDAQRLIFSLEQIDAARCDRLVQRERIDAGELQHRHEHFARDKPNAEVAAHSRKDLIDGLYLHVRTERQVVPQKEVGIEIVGRCSLGETDDGIRRAFA